MLVQQCALLRVIKDFDAMQVLRRAMLRNASMRKVVTKLGTLDYASYQIRPARLCSISLNNSLSDLLAYRCRPAKPRLGIGSTIPASKT